MNNFFELCLAAILEKNIPQKCQLARNLHHKFSQPDKLTFVVTAEKISIPQPGKPDKPQLVAPFEVPKRKLGTQEGLACLIHALAHIEFNAINLALDACYRFQNMPTQFYADWLEVAVDEIYHFELLNEHLAKLGYSYGDFAAHNGLWDMALKTEHDVIARMALVPRVLEARGVDAVPEMQKKLHASKDLRAIQILDIIHQDEIKHVSYGDKWFKHSCKLKNLDATQTFFNLFEQYKAPKIRGPFNRLDRKKAGFSDIELDHLIYISESYHEKNSCQFNPD